VLTLPLLFSGIVFSTLLSSKGQISGMIAMNLLGAICGGLLEYNSMYFGFQFLYLIAMGCYVLAFVSEFALPIKDTDGLPIASNTIGRENESYQILVSRTHGREFATRPRPPQFSTGALA